MEFLTLAMELITLLRLGCTSMLLFVQKRKISDTEVHLGQAVEFLPVALDFSVQFVLQ